MIPILFEIGPIKIYSFGLMMGIAFIVAHLLLTREFRRKGLPEEKAGTITLIALVAGVAGAKLFSVLENWDQFIVDPIGEIFSAAGLTFYGGLLLAIACLWWYIRRQRLGFLRVCDSAAPSLILAYGIGRIGCQLAGDGDYGIPTDVPWAMTYPKGTVSTLSASSPDDPIGNHQLTALYKVIFPDRPVPVDIPVHPTPIYETLAAIAIFTGLWLLRKHPMATGMMFGIYLILAGLERFLVEFLRLNPEYGNLSQAQWIAVGMILFGSGLIWVVRKHAPEQFPLTIFQNREKRKKGNARNAQR